MKTKSIIHCNSPSKCVEHSITWLTIFLKVNVINISKTQVVLVISSIFPILNG